MTRQLRGARAVALGIAVTCLGATSLAQQGTSADRPGQQDQREHRNQKAINFLTYGALTDTAVTNRNNEEIGSISDAIVERGSGQCTFLIVKSGDWAGLGGRLTAIPVGVFDWDRANEQAVLNATPEQLARLPEFTTDRWEGLSRPDSVWDDLAQALAIESEKDEARESHISRDGSIEPIALSGNITSVQRRATASGEDIVIHVQREQFGEDGRRRGTDRPGQPRGTDRPGEPRGTTDAVRVVLGPSWYVMSQPTAPMRGDSYAGEVVRHTQAGNDAPPFVALSAEINDEPLALRDDETYEPLWKTSSKARGQERDKRSVRAPYALLSDISGADVQARGQACGEVSDMVLEQRSWNMAFLVIDPDENFLGIADTSRLVPFDAASVGTDGVVRIDATRDMVLNSRALPEDVSTLESGAAHAAICKAYGLEAREFEPVEPREWREIASLGGWSSDSTLKDAVSDAKDVQVEGEIARIERRNPSQEMSRATIVVVNTGEGTENVLLGPSWYIDRQSMPFKVGDHVTLTARSVEIGGRPMLVAVRMRGDAGKEMVLWTDNSPAWDRR